MEHSLRMSKLTSQILDCRDFLRRTNTLAYFPPAKKSLYDLTPLFFKDSALLKLR